jgi:nucleoside-diphosphate-sugar epimerase
MILVTGASGLIGGSIAKAALAQGQEVRVQVRNRKPYLESLTGTDTTRLEVRECDFSKASERELKALVSDCSEIVHSAAIVHRPEAPYEEYELVNVRTTESLARFAEEGKANAFVFFSTVAVYGEGPYENLSESGPVNPTTPYAVSKLKSEQLLERLAGIPKRASLRPPLVYGPGDRGNLLKLIQRIKSRKYFYIGGGQARKSMIYGDDLAAAVMLLLQRMPDGYSVFNTANPNPGTIKDLCEAIARSLGTNPSFPSFPEPIVRAGVKIAEAILNGKSPLTTTQVDRLTKDSVIDVSRFIQTTGFKPAWTAEKGIDAEVQWAKSAGLL